MLDQLPSLPPINQSQRLVATTFAAIPVGHNFRMDYGSVDKVLFHKLTHDSAKCKKLNSPGDLVVSCRSGWEVYPSSESF